MYPTPFTDFVFFPFLDILVFFTLANAKILNEQVITVTGRVIQYLGHVLKDSPTSVASVILMEVDIRKW